MLLWSWQGVPTLGMRMAPNWKIDSAKRRICPDITLWHDKTPIREMPQDHKDLKISQFLCSLGSKVTLLPQGLRVIASSKMMPGTVCAIKNL